MKVLLTMFNTVETHHSDRFVKVRLQRTSVSVHPGTRVLRAQNAQNPQPTCWGLGLQLVTERPEGQGLVTVANHLSTLDDPGIISAVLPWTEFTHDTVHNRMRWVLCAESVCFTNPFLTAFFRCGKTFPVARGGGVDQPVMEVVAEKVRAPQRESVACSSPCTPIQQNRRGCHGISR
jgi:hypothetical protein